jgi:hypothetical protein
VKNNGDVLGQAIATVTGVQGGVEVYRQRLNVYDYFGKKATSFEFSPYTPTVAGDILFTVTIADEDPDEDMTTATSKVK